MSYLNSIFSATNQGVHAAEDQGPTSGGGLSQNGKFSYGYASSPGKRSSMEDYYETRIDGVDGEIVGLFGVFDGHGGVRAAEYVKQNLFSNLISHPKFISDTKSAIAETYTHTDSEFLKSEHTQNRDAGSTASTAILVGNRLLVANVGDSRAVICRGGNAFAVSRDHKPDQSDERQRIEDAGGFVMWAGTWRVGGVLAVSRAFGDRLLKQYVVADPEIQEEEVDSSLEFLILASDGLWDVVTNEEAVAMIKPIEDSEQAARRLLREASQRGSADNITCVVVRFLANQGASSCSIPTHHEVSSQKNIAANNDGSTQSNVTNPEGSPNNKPTNQGASSHSNQVANHRGSSISKQINPEDSSCNTPTNLSGYAGNNLVNPTEQSGSSQSNLGNQTNPEGSSHNRPSNERGYSRDNLVNLTNQMGSPHSNHSNRANKGDSPDNNRANQGGSNLS